VPRHCPQGVESVLGSYSFGVVDLVMSLPFAGSLRVSVCCFLLPPVRFDWLRLCGNVHEFRSPWIVGGRQVFPGSLFSETFVYFSNHVHRRLLSQANDFPSTTSAMFFLAPTVFRGSDTLLSFAHGASTAIA
jgi:hypothetical protein